MLLYVTSRSVIKNIKKQKLLVLITLFLGGVFHSSVSTSAPYFNQGLSLQGKILDPNGQPFENPNVDFKIQVLSPGAEACVLYEENQNIGMSGSGGNFYLNIGKGLRSQSDPKLNFDKIFQNNSVMNNLVCAVGNSYSPIFGDTRLIKITFNDGTQNVAFYSNFSINPSPQAQVAATLQDKTPKDFVQVNEANQVTQANIEEIFGQFSELKNLLNGSNPQYAKSTELGGRSIDTNLTNLNNTTDSGKVLSWDGSKWIAASNASGTVSNVGLSLPADVFNVTTSSVENSGILTAEFKSQNAAQVFASPNGGSGAPSFRSLRISDIQSSVMGSFLTGSSCSAHQALQWNSISDNLACQNITIPLATGVSGVLPVANGGTGTNALAGTFALQNGQAGGLNIGTTDNSALTLKTNNSSAMTIKEDGKIGIGTLSPTAKLHVTTEGTYGVIRNYTYGAGGGIGSHFIGASARGTASTPSYSQANDVLAAFHGRSALDENSWSGMSIYASESQSATAQGSYIKFATTPDGTIAPKTRMKIESNGSIDFGDGANEYPTAPSMGSGSAAIVGRGIDSNFRLVIQDGSGRVNSYWNSYLDEKDMIHKYVVANEPAIRTIMSTNGFTVETAPNSANAGDPVPFQNGLTVDLNARVGIGTTTPETKLDVSGSISVGPRIYSTLDGGNAAWWAARGTAADSEKIAYGFNATSGTGAITDLMLRTNNQERMRISSAGNVGIGTTNPNSPLHVIGKITQSSFSDTIDPYYAFDRSRGSSTTKTAVQSGDVVGRLAFWGHDGTQSQGGAQIVGIVNGPVSAGSVPLDLAFTTGTSGGGSTRMLISSSGNVGIGVTAPQTKLQVAGVISPSVNNTYSLGNSTYRFTEVFATNGVINTSDRREKKDILGTNLGLDFINKLRPVSYRWNTGVDDDIHYGLIAQEAEKAVMKSRGDNQTTSIVTHDEKTDRYGVRYSELISPLIKAVQELYNKLMGVDRDIASIKVQKADQEALNAANVKIQNLESLNDQLKSKNQELELRLEKIEKALNSK